MSAEFPEDKRADRVRWRFGCLSYATCFFVVIALLLGVLFRRWQVDARADLEREMARIVSAGEPLWFVDFAPSPIDPDQDATPLYLAATAKLKPLPEAFTALVIREPRTPPGEYPEFETTLELNRPALDLLAQAVRRPYFRLPLDYDTRQPISLLIEPIHQTREFARLLSADVLLSIGRGDRARAATAIEEGLLLSEMLRDEPLLITQMVRMAIAASALDSLETAVAHLDLAPDQFAAIDDLLATMQSRFTLRPSVLGERGMNLT